MPCSTAIWNHRLVPSSCLTQWGSATPKALGALGGAGAGAGGGQLAQLAGAEAVFTSPLTRAAQTCVLALEGHVALARGLTLLAVRLHGHCSVPNVRANPQARAVRLTSARFQLQAARETKNFGGQDTVLSSIAIELLFCSCCFAAQPPPPAAAAT